MVITEELKTKIYQDYAKKVQSYIWSKVGDQYVAEDLCSEVFLKVYSKLDTFDDSKASISTWIYTIAHNQVIDYYRQNKVTEEVPEELTGDDDPLADVCNEESLSELAAALKQLDDRERCVLIGRYYDNKSLKDLAAELDISYSYIKIIQTNALKKMKKLL